MATSVECLVIDDQLRFVLFGLECALNVEFNPAVVERVFSDAERDQVSPKDYTFWSAPSLSVTGRVDDHEPETMWLQIESKKEVMPSLRLIMERANYQVLRWQRSIKARPPAES